MAIYRLRGYSPKRQLQNRSPSSPIQREALLLIPEGNPFGARVSENRRRHPQFLVCALVMESIQRIMVGAEVFRQTVPANRSLEHPAQGDAVNDAAVDAKSNDATRELVHHDENPVCFQSCRFASEQVTTP